MRTSCEYCIEGHSQGKLSGPLRRGARGVVAGGEIGLARRSGSRGAFKSLLVEPRVQVSGKERCVEVND